MPAHPLSATRQEQGHGNQEDRRFPSFRCCSHKLSERDDVGASDQGTDCASPLSADSVEILFVKNISTDFVPAPTLQRKEGKVLC